MKGLWIASCVLLLVFTGIASAQVTFDFQGGGARAEGMGKAFLGVSDDISAVSWNPAGLVGKQKPIFGVAAGLYHPRGYYDSNPRTFGQIESFNDFTFISFLSPIRVRGHAVVLAAAYNQILQDYNNGGYTGEYANLPYNDGTLGHFNQTYNLSVFSQSSQWWAPYAINLGFGTPIMHNLDFGLAINIYTGKAVARNTINSVIGSYEAPDYAYQTVDWGIDQTILDSTKYSGLNFTLGWRYTASKLTAGLVVRTPFSLTATSDNKLRTVQKYNSTVRTNVIVYDDNVVEKYQMPIDLGLGLAYKVKPNWLVASDFEYKPFAGKLVRFRTAIKIRSGGNNEEVFEDIDPLWKNVMAVRLGTEYMVKTGSKYFPLVPVRAGVNYTPIPYQSMTYTIDTKAQRLVPKYSTASEKGFSLGTGVHWSQIHLDVSYAYSSYSRQFDYVVPFVVPTLDAQGNMMAIIKMVQGDMKNRAHRMNLTFTGYF